MAKKSKKATKPVTSDKKSKSPKKKKK